MTNLSELCKPVAEIRKHYPLGIDAPASAFFQPLEGLSAVNFGDLLYSQEYVSALLAELEAKDKRIAELEYDLKCVIADNEDCEKTIVRKDAAIDTFITEYDDAQKIIAELEAKLATPVRLLGEMLLHDWEHRVERQATFQHRKIAWDARLAEDKKAILAAGFTFTVEGDE